MAKKQTFKRKLVKVDTDVWNALKARAAVENRPLFAVLATACRDYLKAKPKAQEA